MAEREPDVIERMAKAKWERPGTRSNWEEMPQNVRDIEMADMFAAMRELASVLRERESWQALPATEKIIAEYAYEPSQGESGEGT